MLFNSYIFIFVFLPIALLMWFGINRMTVKQTISNWVLVVMSLVFYGYFNVRYIPIIVLSAVANYSVSIIIIKSSGRNRKLFLILGIVFNVAVIFYCKYYDFFAVNINAIFKTEINLKNILIPLGISFFTFQQIGYIVDVYRGNTEKYKLDEFCLFITFFPQLIAGPIVRHDELIPQFRLQSNRILNWDNFCEGIQRFVLGLSKKVLIADVLGVLVDNAFRYNSSLTSLEIALTVLNYSFQIYFDFSAYSDMAIGIGKMFNVQLPVNFDSPYKSVSIIEFWKKWHMTLTRFLREYIFIPMGGSRKGTLRMYLNVLIVFLISGLWHGANWTFVIWGGATDY